MNFDDDYYRLNHDLNVPGSPGEESNDIEQEKVGVCDNCKNACRYCDRIETE